MSHGSQKKVHFPVTAQCCTFKTIVRILKSSCHIMRSHYLQRFKYVQNIPNKNDRYITSYTHMLRIYYIILYYIFFFIFDIISHYISLCSQMLKPQVKLRYWTQGRCYTRPPNRLLWDMSRSIYFYLFILFYNYFYLYFVFLYIFIYIYVSFCFYDVVRYIMLDCYIMYLLCSITLYYVILYHDIFLFIFFPAVLFPVSSAISSANVLGNLVWEIALVHSEVLEKSFVPWATSLSYQRKAHLLVTAHWQPMKHSCVMLHIIETW